MTADPRQIPAESIAWAAGWIGAFGSVGTARRGTKRNGEQLRPRLRVQHADRAVLERLRGIFDGSVHAAWTDYETGEPRYRWEVSAGAAQRAMLAVVPLLRGETTRIEALTNATTQAALWAFRERFEPNAIQRRPVVPGTNCRLARRSS